MEILELLFGSAELCGCLIQLVAACMDVWAGVSTVRYLNRPNKEEAKEQRQALIAVVIIAIVTTAFAVGSIVYQNWRR